jgi:hypothetical protein
VIDEIVEVTVLSDKVVVMIDELIDVVLSYLVIEILYFKTNKQLFQNN